MDKITEELTWLVPKIKNNELDYCESILAIKRIFARQLGMTLKEDIPHE